MLDSFKSDIIQKRKSILFWRQHFSQVFCKLKVLKFETERDFKLIFDNVRIERNFILIKV